MFAVGDEVRMRGAPCQRGIVVGVDGAKIVIQYPSRGEQLAPDYIDWHTHWEFDPEFFLVWGG